MADYFIPFEADCSYHIFCRAIGSEKLFLTQKNYSFFLEKFKFYSQEIAETFAYNLLPNHFHFIIRIKDLCSIESAFYKVKRNQEFQIENTSTFIMERFGNLSNSYTKSINKLFNRKGSLLQPLRRVKIEKDSDFASEIFYVHKNAVHHQYTAAIEDWKWSSYHAHLSDKKTLLLREEVMEFFGGRDAFIKFHQQPILLKKNFDEF